jgi:hypothetical protein
VSAAEAAPEGPPAAQQKIPRRRVVVLPVRDFRIDPASVFVADTAAARVDPLAAELTAAAVATLAGEPEVEVLRDSDVLQRDGSADKGIVARGFLHLGEELYRNLRQKDALGALDKGVDAVASEFLDALVPDLASDLYLFQGLSHLEQGEVALAHVAFKNMFFVTPQRKFRRGYFPAETEAAIQAAAVDFVKTYALDMPFGTLLRAAAFRRATEAGAVVYLYLARAVTGDRLEVRILEESDKGGGTAVASSLAWVDRAAAIAQVERTMSSWLACTTLPSREAHAEKRPRFMMDTSGAYSLFLRQPTRAFFHTAGFGFGFAWQPLENLDTFGRLNITTSFADRYGDLIEGFTSVRAMAGVGYSGRWNWGRVFLHMGFEVLYLSDFVSTESANCKLFGTEAAPWCDPAAVNRLPSHVLAGVNLGTGVNVMLGGPVYLLVQAGVSAYFYPFASDLNFPFTAEMGLGYAFD